MSEDKLSPAELVERTTIADVYRADKQLAGIVKKTKLIKERRKAPNGDISRKKVSA